MNGLKPGTICNLTHKRTNYHNKPIVLVLGNSQKNTLKADRYNVFEPSCAGGLYLWWYWQEDMERL